MTLCEDLINFTASIIYKIQKFKISFDKAFQMSKNIAPHLIRFYGAKKVYDISSEVVKNYIKIEKLLEYLRIHPTRKNVIRAWLLLNLNNLDVSLRKCVDKVVQNLKFINLLEALEELQKNTNDLTSIMLKFSLPEVVIKTLLKYGSLNFIKDFAKGVNERILWVRINTLKIDLDKAFKFLEAEGYEFIIDENYDFLIKIISYKKAITYSRLFKEGLIIPQDKASIIVVDSLKPTKDDIILDATAAPGIKTSLIMQLTENNARVIATDISKKRLIKMREILKKLGVNLDKIHVILADSSFINFKGKFSKALIDAPCSGSGTLSKDPAMRIILKNMNLSKILHYKNVQLSILRNVKKYAPEIIYATCSLFPEEGEEVIEEILKEGNIKLEVPHYLGIEGYPTYTVSKYVKRLVPHLHQTEAFFISKLLVE